MGLFDSKSKSSSSTSSSVRQTAIDTAENFQDASAGNLLNLNLAGARVGESTSTTASRGAVIGNKNTVSSTATVGSKGAGASVPKAIPGGSVSSSSFDNQGVYTSINTLDGGIIKRAFDFAERIADQGVMQFEGALKTAAESGKDALDTVSAANRSAAEKPLDKLYYFMAAGVLLLIFLMRK